MNDRETGEKGGDVRLLRDSKRFRVEREDGVTGIADGVVLLVRTVGFGTARSRLDSVSVDDVEKVLFDERRIIVRTYERWTVSVPQALRRSLRVRRRRA